MEKQVFEIDGEQFANLEGFFEEISRVIQFDEWGKNLDAFNDLLCGAMGTPFDDPFISIWKNSALSRERLGYEATAKFFEAHFQRLAEGLSFDDFTRRMRQRYSEAERVEQARASYRDDEQQIALARQHQGETIFDWIIDVFREYPEVELRLE